MLEKRIQSIKALWDNGLDARQIMWELGLSKNQTYRAIREARARGLIEPKPRPQHPLRGVPTGALGPLLDRQEEDFKSWVCESVPEGSTIAEFAVACLLDIYDEEKENG